MPELEIPAPRESALLYWPVLWDEPNEGPEPKVENIHVSILYWPGYTEFDPVPTKHVLLARFEEIKSVYRGYRTVKVQGPAAFGVEKNYPVLLLESGYYNGLNQNQRTFANCMNVAPFDTFDKRFAYNPHCSVDLQTLLDPPKRLILGPPELRYKEDEPVQV